MQKGDGSGRTLVGKFMIDTIIVKVEQEIRYGRHIGPPNDEEVIYVTAIPDYGVEKGIFLLKYKFRLI